jgi:glycine/serine hydroxymethyltransferase
MSLLPLCASPAGAPAMTSRGLTEEDFEQIASFLHEVLQVSGRTHVGL